MPFHLAWKTPKVLLTHDLRQTLINAPALIQQLVAKFLDTGVDIGGYPTTRDALYDILVEARFNVIKPQGAFYIIPRSPIPDDIEFIHRPLQADHILAVPGIGFGRMGYFRLAYRVEMDTNEHSPDAFYRVDQAVRPKENSRLKRKVKLQLIAS